MIDREQALAIVRQITQAEIYRLTDSLPEGCHPYGAPAGNCWYALVSRGSPGPLTSSRLICISRDDGRVLFDGSAGDEG